METAGEQLCLLLPEAKFQVTKPTGRAGGEGASLAFAHGPACRVAVEVVTTMTSADVMWQDGSVECNIRSNDLFPVHHLDNNEFCPGDFVVDKRGSAGQSSGGRVTRSGIRPPLGGGSRFCSPGQPFWPPLTKPGKQWVLGPCA